MTSPTAGQTQFGVSWLRRVLLRTHGSRTGRVQSFGPTYLVCSMQMLTGNENFPQVRAHTVRPHAVPAECSVRPPVASPSYRLSGSQSAYGCLSICTYNRTQTGLVLVRGTTQLSYALCVSLHVVRDGVTAAAGPGGGLQARGAASRRHCTA